MRSIALSDHVLCAATNYTKADQLGEAMIAALAAVRSLPVAAYRMSLFQDGETPGSWDETGATFTWIIGFRVSISG